MSTRPRALARWSWSRERASARGERRLPMRRACLDSSSRRDMPSSGASLARRAAAGRLREEHTRMSENFPPGSSRVRRHDTRNPRGGRELRRKARGRGFGERKFAGDEELDRFERGGVRPIEKVSRGNAPLTRFYGGRRRCSRERPHRPQLTPTGSARAQLPEGARVADAGARRAASLLL